MNVNKKIVAKKKDRKKQLLVLAMAGVLGCGGVLGASAFFTDQAHTDAIAKVGGLNMTVQDLSDLDGDYSKWDINQVDGTITEKLSVIDTAIGATEDKPVVDTTDRFAGNHTGRSVTTAIEKTAADQTSTGIINPGDSGLLQFNVKNVDSKSFRIGVRSTVIVKLAADAKEPDGKTAATLSGDHQKGKSAGTVSMAYPDGTTISKTLQYSVSDYNAYTIEGMGAPLVKFGYSEDGKTFTETVPDGKTANAMQLTYYTELDTLKGSQEKEAAVDGTKDDVTYAFETKFDRLAQNKFQGAQIDIKTDFYALQNRKTAGTWYSVNEVTDGTTPEGENATKNTLKGATGDWVPVDYFEKVINTKENVIDASIDKEDKGTDVSGSLNGAVADGTAARQ